MTCNLPKSNSLDKGLNSFQFVNTYRFKSFYIETWYRTFSKRTIWAVTKTVSYVVVCHYSSFWMVLLCVVNFTFYGIFTTVCYNRSGKIYLVLYLYSIKFWRQKYINDRCLCASNNKNITKRNWSTHNCNYVKTVWQLDLPLNLVKLHICT